MRKPSFPSEWPDSVKAQLAPMHPIPEATMPNLPPSTGRALDEQGVLTALVYRVGLSVQGDAIALDISGDPPELCPWDGDSQRGGDWDGVRILHEDSPPYPPNEIGLWQMTWPWHRLTPAERAERGEELCCIYEGKPTWTRMFPARALPPAPDPVAVEAAINAGVAEYRSLFDKYEDGPRMDRDRIAGIVRAALLSLIRGTNG